MARVKAPLFSLGASGSVGKAIVFSNWKGRDYCREYQIPQNPSTALQVNVRKAWELVVAYWQAQPPATWDIWDTFAEQFQMSGFNQFMSRAIKQYTIQLTTGVTPTSVTLAGDPPLDVWTWT